MKRISLLVLMLLMAPQVFADAGHRLIPAGSLVSCTTGDGRISSMNTAVGDPVLCKVEHQRGDFMLPYGSYLGGQFSEYKDPGHFVGKGWMQLDFDRLYVGDTVVPIDAKVVNVPGYRIDAQGRILGKGHEGRDIALWCIPVLWPIDLLMLPARGPRPALKAETAVTLRVMEDIQVPLTQEPQRDPYGLYQRGPQSYAPEPPQPTQPPDERQQNAYAPPEQNELPLQEQAPPPAMAYAPPMPAPVMAPYAPPVFVMPYPAMYAYGVVIAPRPAVIGYGSNVYVGRPMVRAYAPRAFGYGYAGRGYVAAGYAGRGPVVGARYR